MMAAEPAISMVVHVGDLAYPDGTFEQFEDAYFGVNAPLMRRVPFFPTPGNHEYMTGSAAPYLAGVVTPECGVPAVDLGRYYSFDWGNAHFVSVDSNLLATSSAAAMLAWLDADLAATDRYWRIVFLHHTPYPTGFHVGDPICAAVEQLVNPIVERHGVQLLLAGHEHGYERTYPLAGGQLGDLPPRPRPTWSRAAAGARWNRSDLPRRPLSRCRLSTTCAWMWTVSELTLSAIGLDGGRIDQVTIGAASDIAIGSVLMQGRLHAGDRARFSGGHLGTGIWPRPMRLAQPIRFAPR